SMRKAFDGPIWFAEPHLDKSAGRPPQRQVRINQHRTVEKGSAIVNLSADISERVSGETECGTVVLTQLHSQSSQSFGFGHFLLSVNDPARRLPHAKARSRCGIRCREVRIKFNSLVMQSERFIICLFSSFVRIC